MNYNDSFYEQHRYLTGKRNEKISYNDTKWVNINERYNRLRETNSTLLNEQPFNVIGNDKGFDKLLDLMSKSNYTFDDIDGSLIDTYRVSLKNAMSRNLVNTRSVMYKCNNMDINVSVDKFTHYYIIDAPFNQMHFGDRDEFIRKQLTKMHNVARGNYVPFEDFLSKEISDILGFTILCTVNGFICNDCMIAMDDKGFKFKIGWLYSSDVEFIVYKLDESMVYKCTVDVGHIASGIIPYSALGDIGDKTLLNNTKCLVNIYDPNFVKTVATVPNFGIFNKNGFDIRSIQKRTLSNIDNHNSRKLNVTIYALKYLHEVPNVYPAVNYYDITDSRRIFTDKTEHIVDINKNKLLASSTTDINNLDVCTPPISLDRSTNLSFTTIVSCLGMYDELMKHESVFKSIGEVISMPNITYEIFVDKIVLQLNLVYMKLFNIYETYVRGAILTSLIPYQSIERFKKLLDAVNNMRRVTSFNSIQLYTIDEYYGENYKFFVSSITLPFRNNVLSNFTDLVDINHNYFNEDNTTRFTRPVSEQSFITLRYDRSEESWLFDLPEIKHFKGIGNTFYINDDLKGDEIYKFFVLYSDTESPSDKNVESFGIDDVFDFDKFYDEVDKHVGYIRYWYTENKLMKISKMIYDKYDDETTVQVLSKILKRKIDGDDLIDIYPSDINYESSNITSDHAMDYTDDSDRAPFAINFLFYTLSMLTNSNEDKLQTYFFHKLTENKFNQRYSDINISSKLTSDENIFYPINYSYYHMAPYIIDKPNSILPVGKNRFSLYGLPMILNSNGVNIEPTLYRNTFNDYNNETKHYMLTDNDIDQRYYSSYDDNDVSLYGGIKYSFINDIRASKLMTLYLSTIYDYISEIQTNYTTTYDQRSLIESGMESINKIINEINDFINSDLSFVDPDSLTVLTSIVDDNPIITTLNQMKNTTNTIIICILNNKSVSSIGYINSLISTIKHVYVSSGFDNSVLKRTRALYIHLKKINTKMNLYQYRQWILDIDTELLSKLDSLLANNSNYTMGPNVFTNFYRVIKNFQQTVPLRINLISNLIDTLHETQIGHIRPIIGQCDYIIDNYIFDLFILKEIKYDNTLSYNEKPSMLSVTLSSDDEHLFPPNGQPLSNDVKLIFQPIIEVIDNKYIIKSISKICEYTFFNGTRLNGCTIDVLNDNGILISSMNCDMLFQKISSTADSTNTFNQLINMKSSMVEFQNIHESFTVDADGMIINDSRANMNYEMLVGNRFTQLNHVHEEVLNVKTMLPGPVDMVHINNQSINDLTNMNYSVDTKKQMFFKPAQILHIPINENDGSITSVGGKYFVGQTLYLFTDDNLYMFPIIVTCVDHAINNGFIEARVDNRNCDWFEINDTYVISKYLTTNIECTVIDDNIRNFINEYTDTTSSNFTNALFNTNIDVSDDNFKDEYSLPGDPLFVSNNTEFVYTRLNWFFNDIVPNRFIDEESKKYKFIYIGKGFIGNDTDDIKIKMINHDFGEMTKPELYPILREEPDDHGVRREELEVFNRNKNTSITRTNNAVALLDSLYSELERVKTESRREMILTEIDSTNRKISYEKEYQQRMDDYINLIERKTTWYNVHSYESALLYIENGRAKISPSYTSNVRNIPFNDKLKVFIYDWEHKHWLNTDMYDITIQMVDEVKLDERADYTTNDILYSITINPKHGFVPSKQLLIYFAYDTSDIFDDIPMNDYKCYCRFKPLLSLNEPNDSYEPYTDIRIRKHFNGYEKYVFDDYNKAEDFSINNSFHIKRPMNNGKYTYSPTIRMCDMTLSNNNNIYDFDSFDLYVRNPFIDTTTQETYKSPIYQITINKPIDEFVPDQIIKLICIQNNQLVKYDGNISNIMFECKTIGSDGDVEQQSLVIINSSLPRDVSGTFVCTVFEDNMHKMTSGVVTIKVSFDEEYLLDEMSNWIRIPSNIMRYKELPGECIFVPHENVTLDMTKPTHITLENKYIKTSTDIITQNNDIVDNPFEYYYDTINKTKLPISDTRKNHHNNRLVVDQIINPDIKVIKSTYLNVCRYSLRDIPVDGLIDVTGYVPTPLSRERYEFWVNGRCIDNDDIIIISPTAIQLCNLTSLKNLDVIELVDDYENNELMKLGNVYIDLNGHVYSSYNKALMSRVNIIHQDIRFIYNIDTHQSIQNHVSTIISNPNNKNIENDILDNITFNDDIIDIPNINGVSVYYPSTKSLGISDIPNDKIIELFDDKWKYERLTNPYFSITHQNDIKYDGCITLKQKQTETFNEYCTVHASGCTDEYFSMYISNNSDGKIDDVVNTLYIIPFVKVGMLVLIDEKYRGKWLHSTHKSNTIKLQ